MVEIGPEAGSLEIWLRGLRDQKIHCLEIDASGKLTLRTEDPSFAGDIVQSLTSYLGLRELSSEAKFPAEEQRMLDALERFKGAFILLMISVLIFTTAYCDKFQCRVDDRQGMSGNFWIFAISIVTIYNDFTFEKGYKEVEARLQAETAGSSSLIKNLVVRLEDARILENVEGMRKRLGQLKAVNGDLIRDHEIRSKSFNELVAALKELNIGVQNASRLRGLQCILLSLCAKLCFVEE